MLHPSRRGFLQSTGLAAAAVISGVADTPAPAPLTEVGYGDVDLGPGPVSGLAQGQFEETQSVLLALNEDSLVKPWRLRSGLPAPGPDLGGWYDELPLDKTESGGHGFAPAHCFGQWVSALARGHAIDHDARTRARLVHLLELYEPTISTKFYTNFRYPAYNYDKMVIGLLDAHRFAGLQQALPLLEKTTDAAEPRLPPCALDRDEPQRRWRASVGENLTDDYTWDESYTSAENLYLAAQNGGGERYRTLARRFLLDKTYFDPLSEGRNVLPDHHAYSFCNALSSAMQAYLADGSLKHLRAASNAFDMIETTQSFATGGWGPWETFVPPGQGELYSRLSTCHSSFETPCGSYAHFKLTRYLLRVTRDGRYGDSMERVLYNTVLGAKRFEADGHAFYYSDYHNHGRKVYFPDAFPCCSGTLPQVAADYRILIYLRDSDGPYVNLYLPSTLRWTSADGAQVTITQASNYPFEGNIALNVRTPRASAFALRLRVPAWSKPGPTITVNGQPVSASAEKGFATLRRTWKDGDRIQLQLPLPLRLEAVDEGHPDTVALMRGPLVLFGIGENVPAVTRQQLLSAQPTPHEQAWSAATKSGALKLQPFFAINDEPYRTYFDVD
jgi:uncharacterized protein